LVDDAKEKGAHVNEINPSNEDFSQQQFYKIPPTIVTNTSDDMKIMQEEIFGPVLPVVEYDDLMKL
jgi:coniferyl-aldehyde dehydrogenase